MVVITAKRPKSGHIRAVSRDAIGYVENLAHQGDFVKIPLGPRVAFFLNHPDDIREVLVTQAQFFQKPSAVKYAAKGLFGENLFTTDGQLWEVLRQTLQPAFRSQQVQDHTQIMIQVTDDMVTQWGSGDLLETCQVMMELTMGITSQAFFGVDLRNQKAATGLVRFIELFNRRISGFPPPAWLPLPSTLEMKRQIAETEKLLAPLIEERRKSPKDRTDILSMLVNAQANDKTGLITDRQVRNEVMNLFAAGYEVTANTLAFTLYLIHKHPEVENRLREEIDRILGQRLISFDDLNKMTYLECVLKESMRLLPVTTLFARQSTQPVTWADRSIPKKTGVLISPWTLHRRPDIFEDPLKFDPDRFDSEARKQIPKFAYIPFSGGPRICLGQAFAMTQMSINLAIILQRYRLSTLPDYQLEPYFSFNTRPKNGLPMKLEKL